MSTNERHVNQRLAAFSKRKNLLLNTNRIQDDETPHWGTHAVVLLEDKELVESQK